jgi:3,4-dihydroxy-2-butanone 4-phosphate synthase
VRAAHNQSLFREVNERIAALSNRFAPDVPTNGFVCECLDMGCADTIQLTPAEYERLRADDNQFVVVPGHEDSAVEQVVAATDHYLVVKKLGAGGALAEELA